LEAFGEGGVQALTKQFVTRPGRTAHQSFAIEDFLIGGAHGGSLNRGTVESLNR
jgi:hypothetical protein